MALDTNTYTFTSTFSSPYNFINFPHVYLSCHCRCLVSNLKALNPVAPSKFVATPTSQKFLPCQKLLDSCSFSPANRLTLKSPELLLFSQGRSSNTLTVWMSFFCTFPSNTVSFLRCSYLDYAQDFKQGFTIDPLKGTVIPAILFSVSNKWIETILSSELDLFTAVSHIKSVLPS